jgi:predicted alpha/beta hydrolase
VDSFHHPRVFNPLDLEIIDRVYEAAWAQVEARELFRDRESDSERQEALRKLVMDQTDTGRVDFDTLFEKVMANMPENWVFFVKPSIGGASGGSPEVGA